MFRLRLLCAGVLAVLALGLLPAGAAAGPGEEMVGAINHVRMTRGLPPLRTSPTLNRSSYGYARLLMRTQRFGHARYIHASRAFRPLGEVLELHPGRTAQVRAALRRWLHSPTHRRVLLSRSFRYVGVGLTSGRFRGWTRSIWVAQLGG